MFPEIVVLFLEYSSFGLDENLTAVKFDRKHTMLAEDQVFLSPPLLTTTRASSLLNLYLHAALEAGVFCAYYVCTSTSLKNFLANKKKSLSVLNESAVKVCGNVVHENQFWVVWLEPPAIREKLFVIRFGGIR